MSQRSLRLATCYFIILAFSAGCGRVNLPGQGASASTENSSVAFPVADLSRPQIDASILKVTSLYAARQKSKDGLIAANISILASGLSDYVELKIGFQGSDGTSEELDSIRVTTSRYQLKAFSEGVVAIAARACAEPFRAIDVNNPCGDWSTTEFRSENKDVSLLLRNQVLQFKRAELAEYSAKSATALAHFLEAQKACSADPSGLPDLSAVMALVQNLQAVGDLNVAQIFQPSNLPIAGEASVSALIPALDFSLLVKPLQTAVGKLSDSVSQKLQGMTSQISSLAVPGASSTALLKIGQSLFDLFYADKEIQGPCSSPELDGLLSHIVELRKDIAELEAQQSGEVTP